MKTFGLILLFIVFLGALAGVTVYYKKQVTDISKVLESERYSRLVAEEKVVNSVSKIKQLQGDLADNEQKLGKIQDLLKEQKSVNKDLDIQFQRLSTAKSQLEDQIQTLIIQQAESAAAASAAKLAAEIAEQNQTVEINGTSGENKQ
ncbi:MAG: hypothetical protein KA403_06425 [Candidatus Omnitrophica bacterium]|nr:hypothetical protein [Candidatus Omnitrophota bacterium]